MPVTKEIIPHHPYWPAPEFRNEAIKSTPGLERITGGGSLEDRPIVRFSELAVDKRVFL